MLPTIRTGVAAVATIALAGSAGAAELTIADDVAEVTLTLSDGSADEAGQHEHQHQSAQTPLAPRRLGRGLEGVDRLGVVAVGATDAVAAVGAGRCGPGI